jgi:hypothetical protein
VTDVWWESPSPTMILPLALRCLAASLALLSALPIFGAESDSAPASKRTGPPSEIVIKNGMLEHDGQRTPATLRRVVDLIAPAYRKLTVRMVGAENVLIQDVTLRLPRREMVDGKSVEPSLHSLFAALRAASGNRFQVQAFSEQDFLLSADAHYVAAGRSAEVFKLNPLLAPRTPDLQRAIDELDAELAVLAKRYGEKHPKMADMTDRRDVLKATQARATTPRMDPAKLIEQIQDVVRLTLELLNSGQPLPEFKFHAGTGLLVVIGSEEAINVTRKVVAALQ